jgi:hypothetical protein
MSNPHQQAQMQFGPTSIGQEQIFTGIIYHFIDVGDLLAGNRAGEYGQEYATQREKTSEGGSICRNPLEPPNRNGKEYEVLFWHSQETIAKGDQCLDIVFPDRLFGIVDVYCVCREKIVQVPYPSETREVWLWAEEPNIGLVFWGKLNTTSENKSYRFRNELAVITYMGLFETISQIYDSPKWLTTDPINIYVDHTLLVAKKGALGMAVCYYKYKKSQIIRWTGEHQLPNNYPLIIYGNLNENIFKDIAKLKRRIIDAIKKRQLSNKKHHTMKAVSSMQSNKKRIRAR